MRDCKFNLIYMNKGGIIGTKNRNQITNPYGIQNGKKQIGVVQENQSESATKNTDNGEYPNRDSGRINTSPLINKNKGRTYLEELILQARVQFQKMSLREKLFQISHIFKVVKELCKTYGYFIVTQAMLQFTFEQPIKISVWIHPDLRSTKPLHPIHKQTQFQCELACVAELKGIVRSLFSGVELGDAKTFINVIAYIDSLRNDWEHKSTPLIRKNSTDASNNKKKDNKTINNLVVSQKAMPAIIDSVSRQEEEREENNRKRFKNDIRNKETTSTLLDSMKSANSILEGIKTGLSNTASPMKPKLGGENIQPERRKRKTSLDIEIKEKESPKKEKPQPLTPKNNEMKTDSAEALGKIKQSLIFGTEDPSSNNNHLHMKTSTTGKKPMTMSIQIESQINNLFVSSDEMLNNYYSKASLHQAMKNSILSRVAQQFDDIF